jgi:putative transposase
MRRRRRSLCCKIVFCEKINSNKEGTTMIKDNVISLESPEGNADVFTDLLRSGARELIKKAVQTELAEFLSPYKDMKDSEGRPLVVRNGYLPERELMTGIGPVDIKVPKTRD